MGQLLRSRPATTEAMLSAFSDTSTLRNALAFQAQLALAEAAEGLIGPEDAESIASLCATISIDVPELAAEAALAGTLAIPLVTRLRAALPDGAARVLHKGATSQDVADTVLACQIRAASEVLDADLVRVLSALKALGAHYAATPAVGRTLLQDAVPISFGLRIAQWHTGIAEGAARLRREVEAGAVLQFGGAGGTRAGLGGQGRAIAARLAAALGLPDAPPWHARRGGMAGIASAVSILIGAVGKMARDVSLLAQNRVGEAREPVIPGRGGSSAMAHKQNPTSCQVALSAALRAPGLVAGILSGLPAEQERGVGGWQAEGPNMAKLFLLAAGAVEGIATVAEGLEIDTAAIAENLAQAGMGKDIGESAELVSLLLASYN